MEVSIFYADIPEREFPASLGSQSYKDKGFNIKLLINEETEHMPQIALGLSDFAGTGLFSSEYIVGSKKIGNMDLSLGIGWGLYSEGFNFKNPLRFISGRFDSRNLDYGSTQGRFDGKDLFSGRKSSIFGSLKYKLGKDSIFLETNPTNFSGRLESIEQASKYYLGYEWTIFDGLNMKLFLGQKEEFNINFSSNFNYASVSPPGFKTPSNKYNKPTIDLIASLQENGISLKNLKIDDDDRLQLGIRQNMYQNIKHSDRNVLKALNYSEIKGFDEIIVTQYHFGEEVSKKGYDYPSGKSISYPVNSKIKREIYESSENFPNSTFSINPSLRTMIASRESFLYYGLMLEANFDIYFSEKLYVSSKTTYSLTDNFDGLYLDPVTTYPAQVRSDIKDYLKNLGDKPSIERLELNYLNKLNNHYFAFKGGILESMFSGYGFEYLNINNFSNYAVGIDLFNVKKRDYSYGFSTLDYEVTTGHINLFHYFDKLKLTTHFSWGKYLAGDKGYTIDFSRRFENGATFGAYFSITDVSFDDFGEGSFDKGIYVTVPIGNIFNSNNITGFRWTPLTKDPAQKLKLSSRIFNNLSRYIY